MGQPIHVDLYSVCLWVVAGAAIQLLLAAVIAQGCYRSRLLSLTAVVAHGSGSLP